MENVATEKMEWYILHTYSEYEFMAKDSLEKLIENNNLRDQVADIKIPMEEVMEEKNGKKKIVSHKRFPCYIFIKMIYSNQLWYMITQTRGVTGFVGPQGRPIPLKAEEIRRNRLEERVSGANYKVGDTVSLDAGPLAGCTGVICELNDTTQHAYINVDMFGRMTKVEVEYVQMKKVDVIASAEDNSDGKAE